MPSPFAKRQPPLPDAVWHEWIADDGYRTACIEALGTEIDHVERETDPTKELAWVATYEERFGPLDDVWFRTAMGELDLPSRAEYLAGYEGRAPRAEAPLRASWKCRPLRKPIVRASWKCSPARAPKPRTGPSRPSGLPAA